MNLRSKSGGVTLSDSKDTDAFKYFTYLNFPNFKKENTSLLSQILNKELFKKLIHKKTTNNYTFSNLIQVGLETNHSRTGVAAGDLESYETFKDLLYPIIKEYHGFDPEIQTHKSKIDTKNLDFSPLESLDVEKYIFSCRVRAIRNIAGIPLPPGGNKDNALEIENIIKNICTTFRGNFNGKYLPLPDIQIEDRRYLYKKGLLFQTPSLESLIVNSGATRFWPEARGLFINTDQTIACWCNEEDHCRIMSINPGSNLKLTFDNFIKLANIFSDKLISLRYKVMKSKNLGFISTCPSNLGTGFRISLKFNIPNLIKEKTLLNQLCREDNLSICGVRGEDSLKIGSVMQISNNSRIGITETKIMQKMIFSIANIIDAEKSLSH